MISMCVSRVCSQIIYICTILHPHDKKRALVDLCMLVFLHVYIKLIGTQVNLLLALYVRQCVRRSLAPFEYLQTLVKG